MRIYPAYLYGAGFGLCLALIARGLAPSPPPLGTALARVQGRRRAWAVSPARGSVAFPDRWGAALATVLERRGDDRRRAADLRITGRTLPRHAFDKLVAAVALAALPTMGSALMAAGGARPSLPLLAVATPVLGVLGFVVPDLTLRQEADARRREFRFALSSYLNLVSIVVAAGGGVESALFDAARASDVWAFSELRRALDPCRYTGETPWGALGALGDELDVPELRGLAGSTALAGEHGAKIRASITTQARILRRKLLREVQREAEATTEKMSLPVVGLFFGFLILIGYPAFDRVLTGL